MYHARKNIPSGLIQLCIRMHTFLCCQDGGEVLAIGKNGFLLRYIFIQLHGQLRVC